MKDLRDPRERQKFLQERINRNLVVRKLKEPTKTMHALGSNMMSNLADLFDTPEEAEYKRLLKQYRLRA